MVTYAEFKTDWNKIANLITLTRLFLSPLPGMMVLYAPTDIANREWAAFVFVVVVLTDFLDGYFARRMNEVTNLGKILDPLVDKALILLTFVAISIIDPWVWSPAVIILAREIFVTVMRARAKKRGVIISANWTGKVKMVCQSVAAVLLILPLDGWWQLLALFAVSSALTMTIWSCVVYIKQYPRFAQGAH